MNFIYLQSFDTLDEHWIIAANEIAEIGELIVVVQSNSQQLQCLVERSSNLLHHVRTLAHVMVRHVGVLQA